MLFAEAWMLATAVVLGGICSAEDFKSSIVPNKVLLAGIGFGTVGHAALLLMGAGPYYPTWLINMVISDIFALLLYMQKMWAAGDAKLFMVLYFLMPPVLLDGNVLTYSIVPYILIFIPALIWVVIDSVARLIRKEPWKSEKMNWKTAVLSGVIVILETTSVYAVASFIFSDFILQNEMFATVLLMIYAFYCGSNSFLKGKYGILLHILLLIVSFALGSWRMTPPDWRIALLTAVVVLIQRLTSRYNYGRIETNEVKKGMILTANTVLRFRTSRVRGLPIDPSEELTARLTEKEADAVRRWGKSSQGSEQIWIVRKTPFAVMISLGFALWILTRIVG